LSGAALEILEWRLLKRHNWKDEAGPNGAVAGAVVQATLRLRSELECERVIRIAHQRGLASATAYRGPEDGGSLIFAIFMDEAPALEGFLPELRKVVPDTPISIVHEKVVHLAPSDFLRRGAYRPRPFRAEAEQLLWIFAGGVLGAGARILVESGARYVSPANAVFPWGTMLVNIVGSFAIAAFGALLSERFLGERERMFWVLGFLGSFTTFSSYILQTTESWKTSEFLGGLYGGGSMVLGLCAAFLGIWLAKKLLR
jgi:CrcB protein